MAQIPLLATSALINVFLTTATEALQAALIILLSKMQASLDQRS